MDSEPEPDIAIIAGQAEDYVSRLPNSAELVVEVAVSILKKDQLKAEVFVVAGVKEYWIIDATARQLERYTLSDSEHRLYRTREIFDPVGTWVSSTFPSVQINPSVLLTGAIKS